VRNSRRIAAALLGAILGLVTAVPATAGASATASANQVLARITIVNRHVHTVSVAYVYRSNDCSGWTARGWFNLGSGKSLQFSTPSGRFYYHARSSTDGLVWGGPTVLHLPNTAFHTCDRYLSKRTATTPYGFREQRFDSLRTSFTLPLTPN
jgi:uncharacterized membrane protein